MDPTESKTSWFRSRREKVLWMLALGVILCIYATLGFASTLAGLLYNQSFAAFAFLTAMGLVFAAIVTQGFRVRPGGVEVGAIIGIATVVGMFFFRLAIPERSHVIEYCVVTLLVHEALVERWRGSAHTVVSAICAFVITSLVGAVDECVQLFLPNRVFDVTDIVFNCLAALFAGTCLVTFNAIRSWVLKSAAANANKHADS